MRTYYEGHDLLYRRFKAEGQPGWSAEYDNFKTHVEVILRDGHAPTSGKLLELGCGAGNMALWLANKGYEVSGIDISATAIEWANENAQEIRLPGAFTVGDVTDLAPYPDDSFDFVFDGHCLHCIIGDDRRKMLASAYRVLKPGGYLLVDTMCQDVDVEATRAWLAPSKQHYDPQTRCIVLDDTEIAIRYFGFPHEIVAEVAGAGFQILRWIVDSTHQESNDDLAIEAVKPSA